MKYSTMLLGIVSTSFKVFIQTIIYVVTRPIVYWAKKRSSLKIYGHCNMCDTYKTKDGWSGHYHNCDECVEDQRQTRAWRSPVNFYPGGLESDPFESDEEFEQYLKDGKVVFDFED